MTPAGKRLLAGMLAVRKREGFSSRAPAKFEESFGRDIAAIEREAVAAYHDPLDRWRLARVTTDFLSQFGTRTERGDKLTAEWGEPDEHGIYEPIFTAHADDNLLAAERARIAGLLYQRDHDLALAIETLACPEPYEWTEAQFDAAESMLAGVLALLEEKP